MSTADSQLLVGASAVAHDLGLSKLFPGKSLLISRLAIALLVVLAVVVSLALPATIFDRALLAWAAFGAAIGLLVLLRVAGVRIAGKGIFFGMVVGFLLAVFFHFNPGDVVQVYISDSFPATVFERIVSFAAGLLVLLCFRERPFSTERSL